MTDTTSPPKRPFADIGSRIRNARRRKGFSQESLAPMVGTTRRHLIRLEHGEYQARPGLAARLAAALDADASEFRASNEDDEEESLADALQKVVRALRSEMRSEAAA